MTIPEKQESGCPFCAIVDGQAPAREILRTDYVLAFLPDVPAVLGHTLVVPRAHIGDIWDLDSRTGHLLADATRQVAAATAAATGAEGMNIIQSNGEAAGQSVFHLHIHVVPRQPGDRMPSLWPADTEWSAEDMNLITRNLRATMKKFPVN